MFSDTPPQERSGVPRYPTADPNVFMVPRENLPPGFAERVDTLPSSPAAPRSAATVVLLREALAGSGPTGGAREAGAAPERRLEALLLRRPHRSGFAADAWVFPGGMVDAADRDPALPVLCDGPESEQWAERLGLEDAGEAFGYVMAALREAFEETGILLARAGIGADRERDAIAARDVVARHRQALLAGEITLRAIAAREGLRYATDQLLYIAHWITPEPEPRRYDTRFFLAPLPPGQEQTLHEPELVEARWLTPTEAIERFHAGELKMLPPTVHTLRRLEGFASMAALREALEGAPVPTILPRMRRTTEGVVIEIVEEREE